MITIRLAALVGILTATASFAYTKGQTFVGCYGGSISTPGGIQGSYSDLTDSKGCADRCATNFASSPNVYSFYRSRLVFTPIDGLTTRRECYCTQDRPDPALIGASNSPDPTVCADSNQLSTYRVLTTFHPPPSSGSASCTTAPIPVEPGLTSSSSGSTSNINDAFAACGANKNMVLQASGGTFNYKCGFGSSGSIATCGPNTYFVYVHDADAITAPSGPVLKRRAANAIREARERDQAALQSLCPTSLTACRVSASSLDDGFECLDVSNEVESCGGCLHGSFLPNSTSAIGVNCLDQEGVASSTCISGQCRPLDCEDGFTLEAEMCIRS